MPSAVLSPSSSFLSFSDVEDLSEKLNRELKIAGGAESILEQLRDSSTNSGNEALRVQVEKQWIAAKTNISQLKRSLDEARGSEADDERQFASPSPGNATSDYDTTTSALGLDSGSSSNLDGSMMQSASSSSYQFSSPPFRGQDVRANSDGNVGRPSFSTSSSGASLPVIDTPYEQDTPRSNARGVREQAADLMTELRKTFVTSIPLQQPESSKSQLPVPQSADFTFASRQVGSKTRSRDRGGRGEWIKSPASHAIRSATEPGILSSLNNETVNRRLDLMASLSSLLKQSIRLRYEIVPSDLSSAAFDCLSDEAGTDCRAAAYGLLRHFLAPPSRQTTTEWKHRGLDVYLTRTLLRDNSFLKEKEQALKLIRAIVEVDYYPDFTPHDMWPSDTYDCITEGLLRAMIAASEYSEEKLRVVYSETLMEIGIFNMPHLLRAGGLTTLLHFLVDGPRELGPVTAQSLLFLADMPATRAHFQPGMDLEFALSGFTDFPTNSGAALTDTLSHTANIVGTILRSFTGLLYFSMNDRRAIVSLVTALRVSPSAVQESIITMLLSILELGLGEDRRTGNSQKGRHRDLPELDVAEGRLPQSKTAQALDRTTREKNRQRIGLIDQYLSFFLMIFLDSGLVEAVISILETDSDTSRSATLLMGILIQVGNRVLPQSYNILVNQVPSLFAGASRLHDNEERNKAVKALSAVDKASSLVRKTDNRSGLGGGGRDRSDSFPEDPSRRMPRQADKVKALMGMQMDESAFRNLLVDTQVLNNREHTKWNLDPLFEVLQGPIHLPRRMEEATRGTKLFRRLLAFFHPFALQFSDLPATPQNRKFIRLGCTILTTLLASPEGIRCLTEDKLLREIKESFDQLGALPGSTPSADPILARSRITSTLSQGYFEMIGTLSASVEGTKLLSKFTIWSSLYSICHLRTRDDLVKVMIEKLDYTLDGHPRILLSWILTSSNRPLRKFATEFLATLIHRSLLPGEWMVSLLLAQLCDPATDIRDIAVTFVKEACSSNPQLLEMIVSLRPTLDHLGEVGHELLLRFLSTSAGLQYLLEGDYIDREMDEWFHERNHLYVVSIEIQLADVLDPERAKHPSRHRANGTFPHAHFYGELVKTAAGCAVLGRKGHFEDFAHFIQQNGMEDSDREVLAKLKSVLWTVANIGSTTGGFTFLEATNTVAHIVDIAENSPVLTIRGTCFYVIGMLSATRRGAEILQDYGWQSTCTTFGVPIGICLPEQPDRFAQPPQWLPLSTASDDPPSLPPPPNPLERTILSSISSLGNAVLANKASKTLTQLKQLQKPAFSSPTLFVRALELMNTCRFRQQIRRFIWELFDVRLDSEAVTKILQARSQLISNQHKAHRQKGGETSGSLSAARDGLRPLQSSTSHPHSVHKITNPVRSQEAAKDADRSEAPSSTFIPMTAIRRSALDEINPLEDATLMDADGDGDEYLDEDDDTFAAKVGEESDTLGELMSASGFGGAAAGHASASLLSTTARRLSSSTSMSFSNRGLAQSLSAQGIAPVTHVPAGSSILGTTLTDTPMGKRRSRVFVDTEGQVKMAVDAIPPFAVEGRKRSGGYHPADGVDEAEYDFEGNEEEADYGEQEEEEGEEEEEPQRLAPAPAVTLVGGFGASTPPAATSGLSLFSGEY